MNHPYYAPTRQDAPFPGLGLEMSPWGDRELEIIGQDDRILTSNTTDAPFRYVCDLEYTHPGGGLRSHRTGVLIGPRTVLTVGHALRERVGKDRKLERMREPGRMRIIPGRNGSSEPLGSTRASRFILAPGFSRGTATDYGIIHLAAPIGTRVGFWTRRYARNPGDSVGTSILAGSLPMAPGKLPVNLSGYPSDRPAGKKLSCSNPGAGNRCRPTPRTQAGRSALCGTFQYRAFDLTAQIENGKLRYFNDTCPGHSGSPVWVRRSPDMGGRVLVGVHIGGNTTSNAAVLITSTVLRFIIANTL